MKTALIIRHTPYEGVAGFRQPVENAGYAVDRIDVTDPEFDAIDFDAPDLLIMMGGPMGVYEQDAHPWIPSQLSRLATRLLKNRPTLGVCLGAQMIAAAMGAKVYPGPVKEIGFSPVEILPAGLATPLSNLGSTPVLHWHGDTFDLPENTERLASSRLYQNQAFRRGPNILALQFHAEMGEDPRFAVWVDDSADSIAEAGYTQSAIFEQHRQFGPTAVAMGRHVIADWLKQLAA